MGIIKNELSLRQNRNASLEVTLGAKFGQKYKVGAYSPNSSLQINCHKALRFDMSGYDASRFQNQFYIDELDHFI